MTNPTEERALIQLALDAGRTHLRTQDLERQLNEALDEVERLQAVVLRLEVEKFDLAERLMRLGSDPT